MTSSVPAHPNIANLASRDPASVAIIDGDQVTTYGELRDFSAATRAGLLAMGLEPGDRVAVIAPTSTASVVSIVGTLASGMVVVPLNPASPVNELNRQIAEVEASLVLVSTEPPDGLEGRLASPPGSSVDGVEPLPAGEPCEPVDVDPGDLAAMLFTSGTAGSPKAAMLSYANLAFVQQILVDHPDANIDTSTVNLIVLPLAHIYGLNVALLTTLRAGGTVVLMERFEPCEFTRQVVEHGVTVIAGVPPMWRALLSDDTIADDTFAAVDRITTGASACPVSTFNEFRDRFGIELSEGYGLTETASLATGHVGIDIKPGTVGQPFDGVEVVVVDYDGRPAPLDDSGIVKIRGKNVFLGYWNNEEATKAVLDDDGWLNTGDVGLMSEDDYLRLVDRAKDLIIVSGFNVYPFEVEEVLNNHPSIDESLVIGRDDDIKGEHIVAYATLKEGAEPPSLADVSTFCRTELARYKVPSELNIVDLLPIAPSGKKVRRELT